MSRVIHKLPVKSAVNIDPQLTIYAQNNMRL